MLDHSTACPISTTFAWAALFLLVGTGCGDDDSMSDAGVDMSSDTFLPAECESDSDCDDGLFCNGAETCSEGMCMRPEAPECDDELECTVDVCDESTDSCSNTAPDVDGDGVGDMACVGPDGPLGSDCDDSNPDRFPGNTEVCDEPAAGAMFGLDEDCDASTFGEIDSDGDGAFDAACTNGDEDSGTISSGGEDCDDDDVTIRPGQLEICDLRDNDCDGMVDEEENSVLWYPDLDGDLFGDPDGSEILSCTPVPEHSLRPTDCDDTRTSVRPTGTEVCNGLDDDCDSMTDEGLGECTVCSPNPCEADGVCTVIDEETFSCECTTGFVGDSCEETCDVEPAFLDAPEGRPSEVNHVREAALFADSHLPGVCDGPCEAAFAADGQRCGVPRLANAFVSEESAAGESWRADWSAQGAQRIDRIEVYGTVGPDADGLDGASIRVDGFEVATFPDGMPSEAFVFDPPLYGSSVEVVKTRGDLLFGLAEVEVWGEREDPVSDIAFLGAVRQSSVLAVDDVIYRGVSADAGPLNAVDGRASTIATTKPFARAGTLSLDVTEEEGFPYNTGNQDEAPLIGRNSAWWLLDLERPQTVRAIQIHRGDNPARLDAAEIFLEIDGELEATPRWSVPFGDVGRALERFRPEDPIEGVTAIKIVSALESDVHPGLADSSLEIREVRVWADEPSFGTEPLRDLTTRARVDFQTGETVPAIDRTPIGYIDGSMSQGANSVRVAGTFANVQLRRPHDIRRVELYNRSGYPSNAFFAPGGCPQRSLCGDTYGGCSYQPFGAIIRAIDEDARPIGESLGTVGFDHYGSVAIDRDRSHGLEIRKEGLVFIETSACGPERYFTQPIIAFDEIRIFGFWGSAGVSRLNYATTAQNASISQSPSGGEGAEPERAINAWMGDHSATAGGGVQELLLSLERPVLAESLLITSPTDDGVTDAEIEVLVDGGRWVDVATLVEGAFHQIRLPPGRLIAGVRIRRSGSPIEVSELEVLALPRY